MSKLRQGDILLFNTSDGGEIQVINGEPEMDGGYESAAYMSLFQSDGQPYWIDEYQETESEKTKGRFYNFIIGNNKTIQNLNRAVIEAESDLDWFITDGIADIVNVDIDDLDSKRIQLNVEILKDGEIISKNEFEINWGYQKNDSGTGRIV